MCLGCLYKFVCKINDVIEDIVICKFINWEEFVLIFVWYWVEKRIIKRVEDRVKVLW